MKPILLGLPILVAMALVITPARAGLYDDAKQQKTGDIADQDYWFTKFDMMMLDMAIQQHQPEGKIGLELVSTINRLKELTKTYPNHEGLKTWLAHAQEVQAKIDPDAPRGGSFNAGCPWDEANFAQLWVNFNYSKMLLDAKDYEKAYSMLTNVIQNYDILLKPDRIKDYPDDLKKWVTDHKADADKMMAEAKDKTHR